MNIRALLLGAAVALAATAAWATVTFDPNTGTGFVGKGDVQTVEGWNNATMQANAPFITFKYDTSTSYSVNVAFCPGQNSFVSAPNTCTDGRSAQTSVAKTGIVTSTQGINSIINGSARSNSNNQVTGFNLDGYDTPPTTSGGGEGVPTVGEACNADPVLWAQIQALPDASTYPGWGGANTCQITSVTVLSSGSGGLYVGVNGTQWVLLQAF